ncbi:aldo/keto reductase [Candidatus Koribacter versatilis Ellin345]|uniref:Aldo/keto reductase n=1 Tax=Koribacter versatilis (strain Ellin345) TaxID=204669 RepID=Q1IH94_KORVE|nr:aldo/keto reductase [Candidatus Koribacter versatilis]ABF43756.1 aldo/keto reductase [Candidatus Koribacter versatilis Ellin345]
MSLAYYNVLGRSGLKVSPLCLGTMTFGTEWGWGSAEDTARQIFNAYLDAGGNFIDTANGYTGGTSETLIGKFIKDRGDRDRIVLATKFAFAMGEGDPNGGGNGRKNIYAAVEASLRRLQTDYLDLYWVHNWDRFTPVEEVMATLTGLVREGKVRYIGMSNSPAWYVARAQSLAEFHGLEKFCAWQLEYSLLERNIEREHIPAALEFGMGIMPWSPIAGGMLSGKYKREKGSARPAGEGRLSVESASGNPAFNKLFTERNWKIIDALHEVAKEVGKPPAQVALNWVTNRTGVSSTIIGASKLQQFHDSLAALDFELPESARKKLDEVSAPEEQYPYLFFGETMQAGVTGKTEVRRTKGL